MRSGTLVKARLAIADHAAEASEASVASAAEVIGATSLDERAEAARGEPATARSPARVGTAEMRVVHRGDALGTHGSMGWHNGLVSSGGNRRGTVVGMAGSSGSFVMHAVTLGHCGRLGCARGGAPWMPRSLRVGAGQNGRGGVSERHGSELGSAG